MSESVKSQLVVADYVGGKSLRVAFNEHMITDRADAALILAMIIAQYAVVSKQQPMTVFADIQKMLEAADNVAFGKKPKYDA